MNMPTGIGTYKVQVINAGVLVQELTGIIPEPASFGLASLALCGVARSVAAWPSLKTSTSTRSSPGLSPCR